MKQALQDTFEAVVEQVAGPKQKPQSQQPQQKKVTAGLSSQLDPGNIFKDMLKQGGVKTDEPVKTPEEIAKMTEEDQKKAQKLIREQEEEFGIKTIQPPQSRGNIEIINPPKPQQPPAPAYVTGKPEYNPEKQAKIEAEKNKLPELQVPKGKPPRGSWLSAIERKKHGAEIKGGRE
ncbi:hypothetical protein HYT02_00380 [Candidatus Gottesmanbacteria bacterium]|nr:hypothetical protein [Candidatus Gottesmanbacteria bacterium]